MAETVVKRQDGNYKQSERIIMAKLYSTFRIKFSPDTEQSNDPAIFTLRAPTNKELNDFNIERFSLRETDRQAIFDCREKFFDLLLTGIDNLKDGEDQPIAPDRKELIPQAWKSSSIFIKFETVSVDIKN
jgi:hypothetical protein